MENLMQTGKIALAVAIGSMAVAGCGYSIANDGVASLVAATNAVDIPAMKSTALSGLLEAHCQIPRPCVQCLIA